MTMPSRGMVVLGSNALILLAFLIFLAGFASENWIGYSVGGFSANGGLWNYNSDGSSHKSSCNDYVLLALIRCECDSFKTARSFMCFTLIATAASLVICVLFLLRMLPGTEILYVRGGALFAAAAGAFNFIAIATFASMVTSMDERMGVSIDYQWGYMLSVVSASLFLAGGVAQLLILM